MGIQIATKIIFVLLGLILILNCQDDSRIKKNRAMALLLRLSELCELEDSYKNGSGNIIGRGEFGTLRELKEQLNIKTNIELNCFNGYQIYIQLHELQRRDKVSRTKFYMIAIPQDDVHYLPYIFVMNEHCEKWKISYNETTCQFYKFSYYEIDKHVISLPPTAAIQNIKNIENK